MAGQDSQGAPPRPAEPPPRPRPPLFAPPRPPTALLRPPCSAQAASLFSLAFSTASVAALGMTGSPRDEPPLPPPRLRAPPRPRLPPRPAQDSVRGGEEKPRSFILLTCKTQASKNGTLLLRLAVQRHAGVVGRGSSVGECRREENGGCENCGWSSYLQSVEWLRVMMVARRKEEPMQ